MVTDTPGGGLGRGATGEGGVSLLAALSGWGGGLGSYRWVHRGERSPKGVGREVEVGRKPAGPVRVEVWLLNP